MIGLKDKFCMKKVQKCVNPTSLKWRLYKLLVQFVLKGLFEIYLFIFQWSQLFILCTEATVKGQK